MKLLDLISMTKIRTRKIGKRVKFWHSHWSNIGAIIVGDDCIIHSHVWIADGVKIGYCTRIEAFAFIPEGVTIGNNVFIGPHVCFTNDPHPPSDKWLETHVQSGAVVGAGSVILPGVTLGKKCIIGAGSVVTKDVPPGETWAGNPARPLA